MSHTTFVGKRFKSYSADRLTRSLARLRAALIKQVGASGPARQANGTYRHLGDRGYSADRTTADQRLARDAPLAGGPGSAGYRRLRVALA